MEQILYLCAGKATLQLHKIHERFFKRVKKIILLLSLSLKLEYLSFSVVQKGSQKLNKILTEIKYGFLLHISPTLPPAL